MSTFDDREKAFERKFAHDAEMQFKAEARRDRLLGLWAAGLMGLPEDEALDYAKTVVIANLEEAGDDDVHRKVAADLEAKGVPTEGLRAKMNELMAEAKAQLLAEAR